MNLQVNLWSPSRLHLHEEQDLRRRRARPSQLRRTERRAKARASAKLAADEEVSKKLSAPPKPADVKPAAPSKPADAAKADCYLHPENLAWESVLSVREEGVEMQVLISPTQ